jgi:hypothetical protein
MSTRSRGFSGAGSKNADARRAAALRKRLSWQHELQWLNKTNADF